jgi:hypothetical protein
LTEITAIEDMLDPHSGGFFRSRTHVRHCRRLLNEAVALLLWLEEGGRVGFSKLDHAQDAAKALQDAAELLKTDALTKDRVAEVNRLLRHAIALQPASILRLCGPWDGGCVGEVGRILTVLLACTGIGLGLCGPVYGRSWFCCRLVSFGS